MKIIITGGHFSPAYTVLKKLREENEVLVIGRKYAFEGDKNETFEYKLCQKEKIPFIAINAGRLQRVLTKHTIPSALRFPKGIYETLQVLKKEKPDVVLTFGGYIGLTVSIAAHILRIPVVLHEQIQKAGLSSKLISRFASVVCVSFASSLPYFRNRNTVVTGNPVREEIFNFKAMDIEKNKPIIYITGGSTGSHAINQAIYEILDELLKEFIVVHQTGNSKEYNDFEKLLGKKKLLDETLQNNYIVQEFFEAQSVGWLLHNSSLLISRAGINTVTEILATGMVCLLIPFPYGQTNEQLDNAKLIKKVGLGEYIEQKNLTSEILLKTIFDMIKDRGEYLKNKEKAKELVHPNAVDEIIKQVNIYGGKGREIRDTRT